MRTSRRPNSLHADIPCDCGYCGVQLNKEVLEPGFHLCSKCKQPFSVAHRETCGSCSHTVKINPTAAILEQQALICKFLSIGSVAKIVSVNFYCDGYMPCPV